MNKKSSGSGSGSKENGDKKSGSKEKENQERIMERTAKSMKKTSKKAGSKENCDRKSGSKEKEEKMMEMTAKSLKKTSKKSGTKDTSASRKCRRQKFTTRIGQVLNKAIRREKEKSRDIVQPVLMEPSRPSVAPVVTTQKVESSRKRIKPKKSVSKTKSKKTVQTGRRREPAAETEKSSANAKSEKNFDQVKSEKLARLKKTQSEMVNKVEKSIRDLLQQLGPKCTSIFEEQWEYVDSGEVYDNDCLEFLQHWEWNQAEEIEVLDSNRVKLEKSDIRDYDYIHASHIEIKGIPRKFILAQLPLTSPKRMSDFWAMIYQEKLHNIYFVCSPDDSKRTDGKQFSEYFPIISGSHENYENIWVHNRKVETTTTDQNETHTIEVLPNGCAESVLVNLQMLNYWPERDIGANRKKVLAAASTVFGVADAYEGDPIGIISRQGAGRSGTFLAILCAIEVLKSGENLNLKEMCRSIREQRPGAIDNYFQFVYIYSIVLQFALQNVTSKDIGMQIEKIIRQIDFILAHKPTVKRSAPPTSE